MSDGTTLRGASGKRRVSRIAAAQIASRVEAARSRSVSEAGWLADSRGGCITGEQVGTVATWLAHDVIPEQVCGALAEWLRQHGADPAQAQTWATSAAGGALLTVGVAEPGDDGYQSVRQAALIWAPTQAEAADLDLRCLVSEAQRSRARRRAEGIEGSRRATPKEPWKASGVSRATWFRRQREIKAVDSFDPGMDETLRDTILEDSRACTIVSSEVSVAPWPEWTRDTTAAGRRYLATARQLGASLRPDADPTAPHTWIEVGDGGVLATALDDAYGEAVGAEKRRQAIEIARERRRPDPPHVTDAQACPRQVPAAVWDEVPSGLRASTRRAAAHLFLAGLDGTEACRLGLRIAAAEALDTGLRALDTVSAYPRDERPYNKDDWSAAKEIAARHGEQGFKNTQSPEHCMRALARLQHATLAAGARRASNPAMVDLAREEGILEYARELEMQGLITADLEERVQSLLGDRG